MQIRSDGQYFTELVIEARESFPITPDLFFEQLKVFLKEFGINFNDPFVKILSMRCAGGITFVVDRGIQRIPYDGTDILYHPKISSSGFNIMDLYQYYLNSHVQLFSKIKAYKSNIYHRYVGEEHRCVGESGKDLFKVICVCNNTKCQGALNFLENSICKN